MWSFHIGGYSVQHVLGVHREHLVSLHVQHQHTIHPVTEIMRIVRVLFNLHYLLEPGLQAQACGRMFGGSDAWGCGHLCAGQVFHS